MSRPQRKPILLLNGDRYTALAKVSFQKAVKLILQEKAVSISPRQDVCVQGPVRPDGTRFTMPWPVAIMLKKYVHIKYEDVAPTEDSLAPRIAVLHRDNFLCQYCGADAVTIDHLIPQSRGGQNTWWNLVAACQPCNSFKADRTPEEAGMKLMRQPFVPARKNYRNEKNQEDVFELLKSGALDEI